MESLQPLYCVLDLLRVDSGVSFLAVTFARVTFLCVDREHQIFGGSMRRILAVALIYLGIIAAINTV
jgi:hypothetical protein